MNLDGRLRDRMLPPAFGWAAWFLRRIVDELGALPLPEAIRRITSLPAAQAGLGDRGRLAVGSKADVVVLDPRRFASPTRSGRRPLRRASTSRSSTARWHSRTAASRTHAPGR